MTMSKEQMDSYNYNVGAALRNLVPGAKWHIVNQDITQLTWHEDNDVPRPTDEEILAECARLKAAWDSTQYQRDRVLEYPAIGDQLDALFHAGVFPEEMAALIQSVKDKYPKP